MSRSNLTCVHLTRLALTDFRSYAAADLRLEPGMTSFTGANGQGKTNLIEAVSYVATLASHRVFNRCAAGAQRRGPGHRAGRGGIR